MAAEVLAGASEPADTNMLVEGVPMSKPRAESASPTKSSPDTPQTVASRRWIALAQSRGGVGSLAEAVAAIAAVKRVSITSPIEGTYSSPNKSPDMDDVVSPTSSSSTSPSTSPASRSPAGERAVDSPKMGRSPPERPVLLRGLTPPARPAGLSRPELSGSPYWGSPYSASPYNSPARSPVVTRRARLPKQEEHRISDLEAEVAAKSRLVDEFTTELELTTTELLRTQQELPTHEHRIRDLEAEVADKASLVDEFTTELELTTTELLRTQQELPKQEHRICDLEAEVAAKARLVDEFTSELDLTTVELLRTQQELQRLKSRPEPQAEIAATARLVDEFTSELDLTTTELLRTQQELHLLKSRPEAEQHVMAVAQLGGALLNCLPKDSPDRDPDRSSRAIRRTYGFM